MERYMQIRGGVLGTGTVGTYGTYGTVGTL